MTTRRKTQMGDQMIFISYPLKFDLVKVTINRHHILTGIPIAPDYKSSEYKESASSYAQWPSLVTDFFCNKEDTQKPLHSSKIDKVGTRLCEYAHDLQDRKLPG